MRFTIKFYDRDGMLYEVCEFSVTGDEGVFDRLEETLYIAQEITPVTHLKWWEELLDYNMTYFTYHGLEKVRVSFDPSENLFICEDVK